MTVRKKHCVVAAAAVFVAAAALISSFANGETAAVSSPYRTGVAGENRVALCFNVDWGEDCVPALLKTLTERNARATFFLTGRWTEQFPECARSIKNAGMEIGNHGLKHASPDKMSYEENAADIAAAAKIIEETLHIKTTLFAPAAGECGEQVIRAAKDSGCAVILWSVDTIDWQKPNPETIVSRVERKVGDGDIILAHPTENTVKALAGILDVLEEKNLKTVPVSELIRETPR
ncbi:MAG: polysaccharide deacetylase family protein [Bacillota bacterium]|jgi:peptidoglycan/xylan/chitin deacetylase (PgdA/CDA1 family)